MLTRELPGDNREKGRVRQDPGFSLSIVIPTWNGLHLLKEHLPSVIQAAETYSRATSAACEILVVDDGSTDGTSSHFKEHPIQNLKVLTLPENRGFASACNAGFRESSCDLVGLVNNDVDLHPEYFLRQAPHFRDPKVFAVTAKAYDPGSTFFNTGGRFGRFRRGFWSVYFNYDLDPGREAGEWTRAGRLLSFYAIGGFATYRRSMLAETGGFLEVLSPFHWEDVDLSYRGWKRGWTVTYEPGSVAWHQASSTINSHFKKKHVESVSLKNRLLFHWINIHSRSMFARHLLSLGSMCILKAITLDYFFFRALFLALGKIPEVRNLRKAERLKSQRSDREVISILDSFYAAAPIRIYLGREEVLKYHQDGK